MFSPRTDYISFWAKWKRALNLYYRLKVWLQDCVRDGFWDLEGKRCSFHGHHVVSQLAVCFLNSWWFLVWVGKVCFEVIQHILSGYICLLNLISLLLMWWFYMKEWFHSPTGSAFQIIFFFFFFFFLGSEGGYKKREEVNLENYEPARLWPGIEQSQNWSPHADRIKCNLLESSSWSNTPGCISTKGQVNFWNVCDIV